MTPVPVANSSSSVPTVFVVGFPVHDVLVQQYRGRVVFQKEYESVQRPDHIPEGITTIYMHNKVHFPHRGRMSTLAKAVPGRRYEELSGLVTLQEKLDELFPKTDTAAASLHIVKSAVEEAVHPAAPAASTDGNSDLPKIRSQIRTSGTIVAWVRDNMQWPCNPTKEARRLMPDLNLVFPDAQESTVLNYVRSLIKDAGLSSRPPRPQEFISRPSGSTSRTVQELVQNLQRDLATFTETFVVGIRAVTDALAESEDTVTSLQEELDASRREAQEFKRDAQAYRRIKADVLKDGPTQ